MIFNFPHQVASIDDVPEIFRNLYEDSGAGFILKSEAKESVDTSGLKSALEKERALRKEATKTLDEFRKLGESPEAASTIMEDLRQQANKAAGVDQRTLDKAKAEIEAAYKAKEATWTAQVQHMESSLADFMVSGEAEREIAAQNGNSLLLMPHVKSQVKVLKDGDKYVARVLDKDGDPRINGRGEPMRIADLIGEMKSHESFGAAFKVEPKAGSGKQPGTVGNQPSGTPSSASSPRDKILAGLEKRG
jgi:hypothetical protein